MKANEYKVLVQAVELGVGYGWQRAHKHVDAPSREQICDAVSEAVISEICEWFDFDEPGGSAPVQEASSTESK